MTKVPTRRAEYFALCMMQSANWLKECADNPSPAMRPRHAALIRLAIRRKTERCLCGYAHHDEWTAGVHHGRHRCARVITSMEAR